MLAEQTISAQDLFSFVTLTAKEAFAWVIVSIMAASSIVVLFGTWWKAKEWRWQSRWSSGMSDEYSSAEDLSLAIAHPIERWCAALPSLLLVLGLLGTFIGLGVALGSAEVDSDLDELQKVIGGLGAKFKTSAYGIFFFLLVRLTSMGFAWDSRRLMWCLERIKKEKDERKKNDRNFSEEMLKALIFKLKMSEEKVTPILERIEDYSNATQASLSRFVEASAKNIENMKRAASDMAGAAAMMAGSAETMQGASSALDQSASGLGEQINAFGENVRTTLTSINDGLTSTIEKMDQTFEDKMEKMADSMAASTGKIDATMGKLQSSVDTTMGDVSTAIQQSAEMQTEAQDAFNAAADLLTDNASKMIEPIKLLRTDLKDNMTHFAHTGIEVAQLSKDNKATSKRLEELFGKMKNLLEGVEGIISQSNAESRDVLKEIARCNANLAVLKEQAERLAGSFAGDDRPVEQSDLIE